jgi:hypothetical protein
MESITLFDVQHADTGLNKLRKQNGQRQRIYETTRTIIASGMEGIFQPTSVAADNLGSSELVVQTKGSLSLHSLSLHPSQKDELTANGLLIDTPVITIPGLQMIGRLSAIPRQTEVVTPVITDVPDYLSDSFIESLMEPFDLEEILG